MVKINREEYNVLKSLGDRWKWIARDMKETVLSDTLWIYEYVPERAQSYWMESWGEYKELPYHLFRFVQWVDSEPYRIAELIEEYESEETEVKSKKELIEKWESAIESAEFYGKGKEEELIGYMKDFVSDLKQLDEPEALSQELPVVPRFVADWIEDNKQFEEKWNDYSKEEAMNDTIHFTIYGLFADYPPTNSHVELRKPVLKWLSFDRGNYFKLINAVRYNYEVAEEQKYFAKIKGHENISSDDKYWNYCITDESLDIGDNNVHADVLAEYVLNATKDDWANLGVNDDNADFVEVEELEE